MKTENLKRAREDTLEKIADYGRRKEVLDNADTTYLTQTKHDVRMNWVVMLLTVLKI